jgi:hypothetical protein
VGIWVKKTLICQPVVLAASGHGAWSVELPVSICGEKRGLRKGRARAGRVPMART